MRGIIRIGIVAATAIGGFILVTFRGYPYHGLLLSMLLCALTGMGLEVFFTASYDALTTKEAREKWEGYSSPLYGPLYALAPPIYLFMDRVEIDSWPTLARSILYAVSLPGLEFITMMFYDKVIDVRPSKKRYLDSGRSIMGYTRIDFMIVWIVVGLFFEHLSPLFLSIQ